jgi:phosphopentomutase
MKKEVGRFIIIVLDGFGIGAMPDVSEVRPQDINANTCLHIFENMPDLYLPTLEKLGLVNAAGELPGVMKPSNTALFGTAELMHYGADTFFGHHEIMGTLPKKPFGEPFANKIDETEKVLLQHGFSTKRHRTNGHDILIVDDCVTVADNIESDPGQAFNVTAAIDDVAFERVVEIGKLVRSVGLTPRVISFGGRGVHLSDLLHAIEVKGDYIGVNAPASGVYNEDYHCVHMGFGVDPKLQAPTILGSAGVPVFLLGKAADVLSNEYGESIPEVDTFKVLEKTRELVRANPGGFFCANVQETDLCGHRENIGEYARILKIADSGIAEIMKVMAKSDILIVMADHGNDPTIGPYHTREIVPLLIHTENKTPANIGRRQTLSDIAATACDFFAAAPPENGKSFLNNITPPIP